MSTSVIARIHSTKKVNRSFGGTVALFFLMMIFGCFMGFPLLLAINNSIKPLDELWVFPPKFFPTNPTFKNYADMFNVMSSSLVPFTRYLFNTVFVTASGTAGHVVLASMCSYPLAKKKFPGRSFIFNCIVLALMFNATVTAIPNFLTMSKLHMINTYFSLVIPAWGAPLGLYLMKQFMEQIPDSLLEAARIDGASQWATFWKMVMPNVRSAWLTLILLSIQSLWNVGATTFIFDEELKTLSYALSQIMSGGIARAGVGAAVAVVMMSVPICIFVFTQSSIIETMSTSGMKD